MSDKPQVGWRGKWFAPPSGGYSGYDPDGEIARRKGSPPKIPATPEGVRRMLAEQAGAASDSDSKGA